MQLQALVSDSHFIHGCPHASRPCPVLANASHLAVPVPLDIWRWTHLCSREKKKNPPTHALSTLSLFIPSPSAREDFLRSPANA